MRHVAIVVLGLVGCSKAPPPVVTLDQTGSAHVEGDPPGAAHVEPAASARVIFRAPDGRVITAADLAHADGKVNWELVGNDHVSDEAVKLHDEAAAAGSRGEYDKALALLARAQAAAPTWPYPLYDTAYTYELMDQPDKALATYDRVLALAPRGFFTVMVSADCLRREAAHEWKPGVCKRYAMVEFAEPGAKQAMLESIVAEAPGVAAAWKELAMTTDDDALRLVALDKALAHDPDPETRGIALANKALVLERTGRHDEAVRILGELALDPKAPLDVAAMAKLSLANITRTRTDPSTP